jgi:D-ribose pyranase
VRRNGILNARLAYALARLGHTDRLIICDAGLPIPAGPWVVDLAFKFGMPPFAAVLSGILEETVVEGATAAEEVKDRNPDCHDVLSSRFPNLELVPHEEIKRQTAGVRLVVRTGEATPYSNVILRCGVPF